MQDDNTCRKYMIPEGMEPSEDRLSLPSMKWRLSEDDSPDEKKRFYYEKAKNYKFNINDLHKYSSKLKTKDMNFKFDRSAMGKIIPQT